MTFGEKVKNQRIKLKMTQTQLGEKIGVSLRMVSSYETDRSRPRGLDAYKKLATALEVNVNYLLNEDEAFIESTFDEFGYRGKVGAENLVRELAGLFAGGEVTNEDMDEYMLALQDAYVIAKKKNRKYTPKQYVRSDGEDNN